MSDTINLLCMQGDSMSFGVSRFFWQAGGLVTSRAPAIGEMAGPRYWLTNRLDNCVFWNCAKDGWRTSDLVTQAPTLNAMVNFSYSPTSGGSGGVVEKSTRRNVLIVSIGTNPENADPVAGAAEAIGDYCLDQKNAGWDDVILCTLPSRTDGILANFDSAYATPLNAIFRGAGWKEAHGVTAICDIGAIPILAPNGTNANNTRYFPDNVHFSDLASSIAAYELLKTLSGLGIYTKTAFVSSSGNDGTAALNDPAVPYQTAAAAIAALNTAYPLGVVCLTLQSDISGGQLAIPSGQANGLFVRASAGTKNLNHDLRMPGNGIRFVTDGVIVEEVSWAGNTAASATDAGTITAFNGGRVDTLTAPGAAGGAGGAGSDANDSSAPDGNPGGDGDPPSNGEPGQNAVASGGGGGPGVAGGFGRSLTIDGFTADSANVAGGTGGGGGAGGNAAIATGGDGGAGGDSTALVDQDGGNGGNGGDANANGGLGGDGGAGGNGGNITRLNGAGVTSFSSPGAAGGAGGAGGSAGGANPGAGGAGGAPALLGNPGTDGAAGNGSAAAGMTGGTGAAGSDGSLI